MKEVKTVGVVGFGVMGAAIGLNAAMSGYRVVFKELNDDLVKSMYDKFVAKAMAKRVQSGKMSQEEADKICGTITGTSNFADLAVCDLIIEAVVENIDLKIQVFEEISKVVPKDTIIVSNTSTFPIATLMQKVDNPARTAGLHYFFPANVNRLVEVIRQKATSDETYEALMAFAKGNKKVAITVTDFPGFAVNPVFIAAYMVLDNFAGDKYNIATLESISQEFLGLKFGIMWVQKGAGLGTCYHAAVSMVEYLGNTDIGYPPVPAFLKKSFEEKLDWNLEEGPVLEDKAARSEVGELLLGSVFCISKHLIAKKVVSVEDLDLGIRTSLAWPKGPFQMMNEMGEEKARKLMQLAVDKGFFKMPPM
ncbi:3-hydroxyacyl-CoA dehydrogenase family protein [Syntrophus buswellii]|jgi:3-hydroxyacyl-CoA dehydrogenase|uniref:3-hydroxyacyl-CoA dehydrogenase family protein n=1 Tax=Syntrophus buswellii TaxID=43774 RepID=UPI0009CF3F6D|nr:MAG: putative 3-hydroxybutyryl-CoA dehydrogenase [Syntrophus sp. PtaB.Bin138]